MINIIVCMKQVLDPEIPPSAFRIDPEAKRGIQPKGTLPVVSPFDESALEAALRIKDVDGGEITVISMGPYLARPVLKRSLAAGADKLILLEDNVFGDVDSYGTACTLAAAINMMGEYHLILCGMQAADSNAGQVGSGIAEILDIPSVTMARKVEVGDGWVRVERVVLDGYEVIEAPMPVLITVSNEVGRLRPVSVRALMGVQKKPVTIWRHQDVGVDLSQLKRTNLLKLFIPVRQATRCRLIEGKNPEEKGRNLALKCRESKLI